MQAHVLRVHSGFCRKSDERVFQCGECPCSFRKVGSLNAHVVRFHSTELPGQGGRAEVKLALKKGDGKLR